MIILQVAVLAAGFYALIKGADFFVEGSAALARNLKVPALIIGLTIVAMGTSAPELAVSTAAAIQGANEIALSNVVGSNIFNLLVVLGLCAALHPVPVERDVLKRDFPVNLVMTVFTLAAVGGASLLSGSLFRAGMAENAGTVTRPVAGVLLAAFIVYLAFLVVSARKTAKADPETPEKTPGKKCALLILAGLVLIVGGGEAVVWSAKGIARALGMTETLIGLTVVAMGTSLPELATSLVAAKKGQTELAVGNAVGSNIFNLLLILSVSALVHPVEVNAASVWDLIILIAVTAMTWVFAATARKIRRPEGIAMVLAYIAVVAFAIVR